MISGRRGNGALKRTLRRTAGHAIANVQACANPLFSPHWQRRKDQGMFPRVKRSLFAELKRRSVIRVAIAYVAVSWLALHP